MMFLICEASAACRQLVEVAGWNLTELIFWILAQ